MNIKQIDMSGHRYDICDANMRASVADEYDVLVTYVPGDFCIYDNSVYRCIEETTGGWQDSCWEKKTLAEMYKEMEIMTHISDAFSALKNYEKGGYCIYNNVLYKFTEAKTAGEWDPEKVVATSVDEEMRELNENMNKCVLLFDRNITNTSTEYAINDDVSHFRIIIAIGSKNADKVIRGYATVPVAALTFFNGVYVQESMPGNITDLISLSFFGNKISTYYRGEMSHLRIYGMF